jgi:hypothetical protein
VAKQDDEVSLAKQRIADLSAINDALQTQINDLKSVKRHDNRVRSVELANDYFRTRQSNTWIDGSDLSRVADVIYNYLLT